MLEYKYELNLWLVSVKFWRVTTFFEQVLDLKNSLSSGSVQFDRRRNFFFIGWVFCY